MTMLSLLLWRHFKTCPRPLARSVVRSCVCVCASCQRLVRQCTSLVEELEEDFERQKNDIAEWTTSVHAAKAVLEDGYRQCDAIVVALDILTHQGAMSGTASALGAATRRLGTSAGPGTVAVLARSDLVSGYECCCRCECECEWGKGKGKGGSCFSTSLDSTVPVLACPHFS